MPGDDGVGRGTSESRPDETRCGEAPLGAQALLGTLSLLGSRPRFAGTAPGILGACLLLNTAGCDPTRDRPPGRQVPGGDPVRGREALVAYGCGSCHVIPGVDAAIGLAAAPLDHFAERGFVGGVLPNNADNLVAWIVDPRSVSPRTAMPNLGVREGDARDMAAYLYTLRADR